MFLIIINIRVIIKVLLQILRPFLNRRGLIDSQNDKVAVTTSFLILILAMLVPVRVINTIKLNHAVTETFDQAHLLGVIHLLFWSISLPLPDVDFIAVHHHRQEDVGENEQKHDCDRYKE